MKRYGSLDLGLLYNVQSYSGVDVERILCFLDYFHQQQTETDVDERLITIERYLLENTQVPDWCSSKDQIRADQIRIMTDRMEASVDAQGFVDFANKHIQIQRMIPSCTQEEVLFSCCPEAFLSMLTCESLRDNEIVIVRGCKRFVEYTGYLHTFRYTGRYIYPTNPIVIQDILIMDAVYTRHFKRESVIRDMNKAYLTFKTACLSPSSEYKIVTGNWGCGAFGGDKTHKFLQQICVAAALPHIKFDYSVYMEDDLAIKFRNLLEKLNGKTVEDVLNDERMIR